MVNCFKYTFGENDTVGQHVKLRIKRFPATIPLMHSLRPTLITRLSVTFGWHLKQCCDKHQVSEAASLSLTQSWPQGNQMTDKKKFEQTLHFFSVFLLLFSTSKQISASIGSISRPISSRDHNETDQAIAMDTYESYFRKLDNLFSGKQQGIVNRAYFRKTGRMRAILIKRAYW